MSHGPDPVYVLRGSLNAVTCLRYLSKDILFSGDQDGFVYVWNMETKRQTAKIAAHPGYSVLWIDFINDHIITQARDGVVCFWDKQWTKTDVIKCGDLGYCASTLVDDLVAVPCDTVSTVELFDVKSKQCIGKLQPDQSQKKYGMCMTMRAVEGQSQILIGYENGNISLWDIRSFKQIDKTNMHTESVMCLDYSHRSNLGISGSADDKLISWEFDDNSKIVKKAELTTTNPGFNSIIIREDQKIFAAAGWDSKIRIFSTKKLKPLAILSYHKDSIQCVSFSTDNTLACGSKDSHISLWDIYK